MIGATLAVEANPNSESGHLLRGEIEAAQNDYAAAAQDARAALKINPNDKNAQVLLGMTEGRAAVTVPNINSVGNSGGAQNAGGLPSSASGNGAPGATTSGSNFFNVNAGAPSSARALQSGAVAGSIQASSQLIGQARQDLSLGDYHNAIAETSRALSADPLNVNAYAIRASAYMRGKNYSQALKDVAAGLKIDPNSQALMDAKAAAFNRMGQYEAAKEAAMIAVQNNPNDAKAYYELADALAGLGDKNGMVDALRNAARLDPRYDSYLQAAMQIPADQDLASLFNGGPDSGPAAPNGQGRSHRLSRFSIIALSSILGGILLAMGLIHAFSGEKAEDSPATAGAAPETATAFTWPAGQTPATANGSGVPQNLRGQYQIRRQIGAGGMGTVYEGYDTSLGRQVAVKRMRDEIKSDKRERERFISEAKLVASLHHPNIVDIYAIVEEGQDAYLIFEYVRGKTIREILSEKGRMGLSEAVSIFRSMASALDYAHARGVVHRDLKPSNVMMSDEGGVKVMDFGIARAAKDAMTRSATTGTILGTPPYMAPEQERGVVRKESDVYALGISLYEMLSGRLPFNGGGSGMLMNKINKEYAPLSSVAPGLPPALDRLMAQAFEPDPDKRIQSPKAFVAGLDEVLAQIQPA
ncbi:MAG: protein kinase [Elusimicrobia bacterium]|nr:protein kinase [Elusimicrobiota bacterium]